MVMLPGPHGNFFIPETLWTRRVLGCCCCVSDAVTVFQGGQSDEDRRHAPGNARSPPRGEGGTEARTTVSGESRTRCVTLWRFVNSR